jgi:hypothetical protein
MPGPRWIVATLALLIATFALPAPASSQVIRGDVFDRASGEPVAIAVVVLLGEGERSMGRVVTDERGAFILRPPGAGRYRLQVERIGFRTYTSEHVVVTAGETTRVQLGISSQAVRLEAVAVDGERRCRIPQQEGLLISDLWEEARKALELAVWTEQQPHLRVVVRSFERTLDLVTQGVLDEQVRTWTASARDPFFASPPEELAVEGYVRQAADGSYVYHGLAPATILSEPFQETHCFRVRPPGRGQPRTEIGLAFEPAPGHALPDVAGVLWIDRETATLQRIEYVFTRHLFPMEIPSGPFGGRTDLRRLENGALVVDGWWIRMPLLEQVVSSDQLLTGVSTRFRTMSEADHRRQLRRIGMNIRAVGATAVSIALAGRPARGTASVHGVVYDSIAGSALAGAVVYGVGTDLEATSDSAGRFVLDAVTAGETTVAFRHPRLDLLGLEPRPVAIRVVAGVAARVDLTIPSAATVLGSRCQPGESWVAGFVRSRIDGAPIPGIQIVAEWDADFRRDSQGAFHPVRHRRLAATDRAGSYVLCGVRPGNRVRVLAHREGAPIRRMEVGVPDGGGGRADFTFE